MPRNAKRCPRCGIALPSAGKSAAVQGVFCAALAVALAASGGPWWMYVAAALTAAYGGYQFYLAFKAGTD